MNLSPTCCDAGSTHLADYLRPSVIQLAPLWSNVPTDLIDELLGQRSTAAGHSAWLGVTLAGAPGTDSSSE